LWKTQDNQRCVLQDNNVSMIISIGWALSPFIDKYLERQFHSSACL
jgi:hypothetical protein